MLRFLLQGMPTTSQAENYTLSLFPIIFQDILDFFLECMKQNLPEQEDIFAYLGLILNG